MLHSFAYRSTSDFKSEYLPYGIGVKPACPVPKPFRFPQDIRTMMDEQRATEASGPQARRVCIGGEIYIYHLSRDGCHIYTLDRFENYNSDEIAIYENLAKPGKPGLRPGAPVV